MSRYIFQRFYLILFFLGYSQAALAICPAPGNGGSSYINYAGDCVSQCPMGFNINGGICVDQGLGSYQCVNVFIAGRPGGTMCEAVLGGNCGSNRMSDGINQCVCAPGYTWSGSACTSSGGSSACPATIPPHYMNDPGGRCINDLVVTSGGEFGMDPSSEFPICGTNRIPVSGDGAYLWSQFASSGVPNTANQITVGTYLFRYTTSTSSGPVYGYEAGSRCSCLGTFGTPRSIIPSTAYGTYSVLSQTTSGGKVRMYPDTVDVISSQNNNGTVRYGPLAISTTIGNNGRTFTNIYSLATSFCGCPNINETPVRNDAADALSGSYCASAVSTPVPANTPFRVLTPYSDAYHRTIMNQILASMAGEPKTTASPGPVVSFKAPANTTDFTNMVDYNRKIWTCAAPMQLNVTTGTCDYHPENHACDDGTLGAASVPPAPVSSYAVADPTTVPVAATFNALINRKLACCMNGAVNTDGTTPYTKFDCIDNSVAGTYADFNTLWASSDLATEGEQLNAVVLFNGANRPITGFYGLSGMRCNDMSEFSIPAAGLQPYRVNPAILAGQQAQVAGAPVASGVVIPAPASAQFTAPANVVAAGKSYPQNATDYLRCPILVRAAMIATCPPATQVPNAIASIGPPTDASTRCPVASSIQIHVRIEQVYEIMGTAKVAPVDTFVTPAQGQAIDISGIITNKYGGACPPGTINNNGLCTY